MVSFVRLRYGYDFPTACQYLGAWTNGTNDLRREIEIQQKERERIEAARQALKAEEDNLRFELRDRLLTLNTIEKLATEVLRDDPEFEPSWSALADVTNDRRWTWAAYDLLSFGTAEDRTRYILNSTAREEMVSNILDCGFVRTDAGLHEVAL